MDFVTVMRSLGSIASVGQLEAAGFSGQFVRAVRRRGGIVRVRRGWYALPTASPAIVAAARVGGTLACVSACGFLGTWMPPNAGLHVAVPEGSRHLKDPVNGSPVRGDGDGLTVHWSGPVPHDASFQAGVLPLRGSLIEVMHCQPDEIAFAVIESALAKRLIRDSDVAWLTQTVPSRRSMLRMVGPLAGSGTESIFRYRMAAMGVRMRSQVEVIGVGRVDFLIGDRLIVEIDSHEHHGSRAQRIRDLDRDAVAQVLDYLPLRFDYLQVLSDWDAVASTVLAIIQDRRHLSAKSVTGVTRRAKGSDTPGIPPDTDFAVGEMRMGTAGSL
jgi:very-short-patch-repair endonuclease